MAEFRLTLTLRNLDGLKAKIRARTRRQREEIRHATLELGLEEYELVRALANKDTGYMAEHIVLEFTRDGFNYVILLRARDFVGKVNPATGRTIDQFYPVFVVKGTKERAGNDFFRQARRIMKPRIRARYARALRAGG